jgi:hypothetical protein
VTGARGEDGDFAWAHVFNAPVIVASLGYLVDIYDLILFSIVRVRSLQDLGFSGNDLTEKGVFLLNCQLVGMLLGGVLWGVLGDKRGRLNVLFASILLYSIANAANGAVDSIGGYAIWRFIAGVGLAGELGAGVTLVSESLPRRVRGYGTTMIATVGVSGALGAVFVAERYDWRTAYYIGGGLGLVLLVLRISVAESAMFKRVRTTEGVGHGNFFALLAPKRLPRFLRCILIGLPIWFVVGVLITFSPEFGRALGVTGPVTAGQTVFYFYIGLISGDFVSGLGSQLLRSRRLVVGVFLGIVSLAMGAFFALRGLEPTGFYTIAIGLGFGSGYWAVLVTVGAEQFGTNLRATAATSIPNFVRGAAVPLTLLFNALREPWGVIPSGIAVGALSVVLAVGALVGLHETFGKDLDYIED